MAVYHKEAEKVREVARIQYDQKVMEKESVKMSQIEDEAYLARMKAHADADYYTAQKLAEATRCALVRADEAHTGVPCHDQVPVTVCQRQGLLWS